eukprot:447101_1
MTATKSLQHRQGYLFEKSLVLKQLRKRWVVLRGQYLYCYKSNQKDLIQTFDLIVYGHVISSLNCKHPQFELKSNGRTAIIFIANTANEMKHWIKSINDAIYQYRYMYNTNDNEGENDIDTETENKLISNKQIDILVFQQESKQNNHMNAVEENKQNIVIKLCIDKHISHVTKQHHEVIHENTNKSTEG